MVLGLFPGVGNVRKTASALPETHIRRVILPRRIADDAFFAGSERTETTPK